MNHDLTKTDKRKQNLNFAGRLVLILFIGLSIYLFISALILIFLTKPDKEIEVPYVTGKRFIDVYNSLIRKGLTPQIELYDVYDIDNGVILNQYPEKGSIVTEGHKIKLTVSRSRIYLPMPNLIGTKLPFALNKLNNITFNDKSYSLDTGIISYIPSKVPESVIIDHSPEVGEEISPDRKINLLISAGDIANDMAMPRVTRQSIELCYDLLLSKGLHVAEEIIPTDSMSKSGRIESQNPDPGQPVHEGMLVKLKIYYYSQNEKQYSAYERVIYNIPQDEKKGLYEAYIEDNKSKRIRFSRIMNPGWKIDFLFKRRGTARVSIMFEKKVIDVIILKADDFN